MFIIFTFFSCASPNYAEKLGGAKPSMKAFYSPILLAFFILLVVLSCCVIIQNICILFSTHIPNIVLILEHSQPPPPPTYNPAQEGGLRSDKQVVLECL